MSSNECFVGGMFVVWNIEIIIVLNIAARIALHTIKSTAK